MGVGNDSRQRQFEEPGALADRDPVFEAEGPHLANQAGAVADHLIADAMKCLKVNLVRALEFDKPHRRTGDCLSNCSCIDRVILVGFNIRLHAAGRWDK